MAKLTKTEAEKKVYELTEKLIFTKKDFRDIASGYKEKIKDFENEIKAVVEETESLTPTPDVTTDIEES
jgi:predicted  nucleic acid-binding Zn-ribbon protein